MLDKAPPPLADDARKTLSAGQERMRRSNALLHWLDRVLKDWRDRDDDPDLSSPQAS